MLDKNGVTVDPSESTQPTQPQVTSIVGTWFNGDDFENNKSKEYYGVLLEFGKDGSFSWTWSEGLYYEQVKGTYIISGSTLKLTATQYKADSYLGSKYVHWDGDYKIPQTYDMKYQIKDNKLILTYDEESVSFKQSSLTTLPHL